MAHAAQNLWGIVITLDHQETEDVLDVANVVADVVSRLGDALDDGDLALAGFILEAIAVGISLNVLLIEQLDQGNGVYIFSPWVALGTIIPSTRPAGIGIPASWVERGFGTFFTEDSGDLVSYNVQRNVVSTDVVEFRLEAESSRMWRKVLVLRDGLGSQWDITIDPSQGTYSATNGLWADQVRNGQSLSLWKAKEFAINAWVLDIGHLGGLSAGSRAVFKWWKDY
jgi:hypothetical protein